MIKSRGSDFEFVRCNLCGSANTSKYMAIDGFRIVKCKNCSLVYVNPRLKPKSLHKIYDSKYYRNSAFKGGKSAIYGYGEYLKEKNLIVATFKKRLDQIEKFSSPGKLLDVGCAFGFFLELARKHKWNVKGIEISEAGYNYAKNNLKLDVINRPLEEAGFKSGSFDAVTMFDVI